MIQVVCAIIEQEDKVLITQRSNQMAQPLLWEFPGGKLEAGESETEALKREIREELNLLILPQRRLLPVQHNYGSKSIEHEDKVLITQRSSQMAQPLLWEFPGGKLEAGESETEALKREIREELNLLILPQQRLSPVQHRYGSKNIELIPYTCTLQSGEIILAEHKAYSWVPINELLNNTWCPADLPIVEEYIRLKQ